MIKRFAAFAFAAFAAFGAQAVEGEGDIRSVEAVYNLSADYTYPNDITPHKVGEWFYILVRLLNEDHRNTDTNHQWQIVQSATGLVIGNAQATVYWPGLAIAIGSQIVTADFISTGPNGEMSGPNAECPYYTDLYFRYRVKEGQLGMPVRLVNSKNQIIDAATISGSYSLKFVNVNTVNNVNGSYWDLVNDKGTKASFWFGPQLPDPEPFDYPTEPSSSTGFGHIFTQYVYPGLYVQTIDFEPTYADATDPLNRIWRDVYQGISDSPGKDPAIVGTASDEVGATTVYIWSEDESVFSVDGITGEDVSYRVKGALVTRKVYPV